MPRNTLLLVIALTIVAALVVGVNITARGKLMSPQILSPARSTPAFPETQPFTSASCGITFQYPQTFALAETPDNNAVFTDSSGNTIVALCQKDIPGIPLPKDKIETINVGTAQARLYHDASSKDGTPVDKLIFTHPKTGLDIYIAGFGVGFNQVVSTLQLLP